MRISDWSSDVCSSDLIFQIAGRANDSIGDQVRQMAGDGEHQVVMLRVHGFDIRAQSSPELGKSLQRHRVGAGRWRDDAPAAFEQARKSRLRPTIFRARYRMRWNDGAAWQRFL